VENSYIFGDENLSLFDTFSPILIGFFVLFFIFLISGISLLKERTSKTLEKLLSTPIKRYEIVLGYLLGYGIFAIIQTIILVLFAIYVLGIRLEENMSNWIQKVAHIMPLYYGGLALQGIMIKSYAFDDIELYISILLLFAIVFSILNIFGLKRYRKI
jgi:ABC-2 type transport system permease protein